MTERIQDWAKPFTSAKGRNKQRVKITLYIVFQRKKHNCVLQSIFATKYSVTKKNDCSKMLSAIIVAVFRLITLHSSSV